MEIIGIIGEFDPFHRGHAHLIARARAAFPGSPVVCAMSDPSRSGAGRPLRLNMPGRRWRFAAGRTW